LEIINQSRAILPFCIWHREEDVAVCEVVMVETRCAPRFRASKLATIGLGKTAIHCVVRDLSTTGAAIEVQNQAGIPEKFTLVIPEDGLQLPCHVVWRKEFRIGVAFE
jgi:hypothetical protein